MEEKQPFFNEPRKESNLFLASRTGAMLHGAAVVSDRGKDGSEGLAS